MSSYKDILDRINAKRKNSSRFNTSTITTRFITSKSATEFRSNLTTTSFPTSSTKTLPASTSRNNTSRITANYLEVSDNNKTTIAVYNQNSKNKFYLQSIWEANENLFKIALAILIGLFILIFTVLISVYIVRRRRRAKINRDNNIEMTQYIDEEGHLNSNYQNMDIDEISQVSNSALNIFNKNSSLSAVSSCSNLKATDSTTLQTVPKQTVVKKNLKTKKIRLCSYLRRKI